MLNYDLLKKKTELNDFTRRLKLLCGQQGSVRARLREDTWVKVKCDPGVEGEPDMFYGDHGLRWHANGESYSRPSFDLIEIEP